MTKFASLKRTGKPNDYLVCPAGFYNLEPDEESPIFDLPVARLRKEWEMVVARQPRTVKTSESAEPDLTYEQRSSILGFPDTIIVHFIAVGEHHSTVAIYSHSRYGYWDLGVNRRRVQEWLKALRRRLGD